MQEGARALVVCFGEILWDLLPGGKRLGGAPANVAYHVQHLGEEGMIASCVGDDALGHEILEQMTAFKLSLQEISCDPQHPTGIVSVSSDEAGEPCYQIAEDVAWDFIPCSPSLLACAARAKAFCFGSLAQRSEISRNTLKRCLESTSPDCLRIFDVNVRGWLHPRLLEESLRACDVLKLHREEYATLASLLGCEGGLHRGMHELRERYGLKLLAITDGARGSWLLTEDHLSEMPAEPVAVADTVGAGDAFTAAIIVGLLRKETLDVMHRRAVKLSAFVCQQPGAMHAFPGNI